MDSLQTLSTYMWCLHGESVWQYMLGTYTALFTAVAMHLNQWDYYSTSEEQIKNVSIM